MKIVYETDKSVKEVEHSIKRFILCPNSDWDENFEIENSKESYRLIYSVPNPRFPGRVVKRFFKINFDESGVVTLKQSITWQSCVFLVSNICLYLMFGFLFLCTFIPDISDKAVYMRFASLAFIILLIGNTIFIRYKTVNNITEFMAQCIL